MSRFGSVAIWILRFLLAVFFAIQGFVKLSGSSAWVSRFRAWGYPDHFYVAVGIAELAAAVALVVPMTTRFGAAVLIIVMAGATATHALHRESQLITTLILTGLLAIVLYSRRRTAAPENRSIVDPQ